jgi:superfamily II RNA helicase
MVAQRRNGNVLGIREDGRSVSLTLQRIGRVYSPVYPLREDDVSDAFKEIQTRGKDLVLPEPRLRDVKDEESDALDLIENFINSVTPGELGSEARTRCVEALWSTLPDAEAMQQAVRRSEVLREEVWQPFEKRARVLAKFGYLDFDEQKVTERGRWLADLHVDRPLLVGEALERGLFATIESTRLAAVMAALTADEDRDYGELELDDALVTTLGQFEEIGFGVSTEEWEHGIEPAPELNFSAAGAAARWAAGDEWTTLVQKTRAEEGDLFRMLSRTGEALLQIAGLRKAHPQAAQIAWTAAESVLREPVR